MTTQEELKEYLKKNLSIGGYYEGSECFGEVLTIKLYLEGEEISTGVIDLY